MKSHRILASLAALAAAVALTSIRPETAGADQGCAANTSARATLIYGNSTYKTCVLQTSTGGVECSGYSPPWTKMIIHMSTAIPPQPVVDAEYKIQGGSITGLPWCRPEVSSASGWVQ